MTFSKMIFLRNQGKIYKIGIDGLDTDESSVNHFGLIANLLLELREKYSLVQLEYISNLLSVKTRAYCRARSKYVCQ